MYFRIKKAGFDQLRCKLLGHKYIYYLASEVPIIQLRVCKRCFKVDQLTDKYAPAYDKGWFRLGTYTTFGAKKHLGKFYEKR